ncbi:MULTISPECIES: DUF5988 family protein [Actinomadura]|uniref:Uncharacterized protein n=2 Tax=Actinomadura geliboluensis TaxID=882440 RepID=A0A5S4HAH7_9ACTN|nr:DUF5988 family protein [Actinomadura geliboluensis]TMR41761.1 hypothetical protein ETD96_04050 [Actinomadura geliboluensis]
MPEQENAMDVVLIGGPADIPADARIRRAAPRDRKIKIMRRGGYEHFELVEQAAAGPDPKPAVFHWTMRTKIAE